MLDTPWARFCQLQCSCATLQLRIGIWGLRRMASIAGLRWVGGGLVNELKLHLKLAQPIVLHGI